MENLKIQQDNLHNPVPMVTEVKKLTQKEIFEILLEANEQEENGQYYGIHYHKYKRD